MVLPELLSNLAEYRLLFFGVLLLVVLWLAPEGVIGTLARYMRRGDQAGADARGFDLAALLMTGRAQQSLVVNDIGITFGGIKAASHVGFTAEPGRITSVIGPNGAGKTTVLNMIGGFYRPDAGSIRLGDRELAGAPAWRIARAGIARTYQTTQLFGTMSVLDNVLVALRRGRLGDPLTRHRGRRRPARGGGAARLRRLPRTARDAGGRPAACRPSAGRDRARAGDAAAVLLLDEPAAGLMRADKVALSTLMRRIADLGIAVILVEHDMALVMGISDHIVVLDAGAIIAAGTPAEVRRDPRVLKAYLGDGEMRARPRAVAVAAARRTRSCRA